MTHPILVVDDHADTREAVCVLLRLEGYAVVEAGNGREAVDLLILEGEPLPCIIILDLEMPVMSGYEATRTLRLRPEGRDLPIIALTAAALTSEREQALASGMNGFLTKPIDAQHLHDAIAGALGRAR